MKLRTLLVSLLLAFIVSACAPVTLVDLRTRGSIVRIESQEIIGKDICTGFVIAPQVVLTAAHCISDVMTGDGYPMEMLKQDEYYDLAVLRVRELKKKPLFIRDRPVYLGETLVGIGYAWGWTIPINKDVVVLIPSHAVSKTHSVGIITQGGYNKGMSGGPLVDQFGAVVGMVQESADNVGYGVGAQVIKIFLLDAGIEGVQ